MATKYDVNKINKVGDVFLVTDENKVIFRCECCNSFFGHVHIFEEHIAQVYFGKMLSNEPFVLDEKNQMSSEEFHCISQEIEEELQAEILEEECHEYFEECYQEYSQDKMPDEVDVLDDDFVLEEEEDSSTSEIKVEGDGLINTLARLREYRNCKNIEKTNGAAIKKTKANITKSPTSATRVSVLKKLNNKIEKPVVNPTLEKCPFCEYESQSKTIIRAHIVTCHPKSERIYTCNVCGLRFSQKVNLTAHSIKHKEPKHCCSFCGKLFYSKVDMHTHERRHTGEKPYKCNLCGKAFVSSSQLSVHKRQELNDRRYACETCGKRFTSINTLKNHKLTHTDIRQFACEYCDAKFKRKVGYKVHLKLHFDEKEYKCDYCQKAFNQKPGLIAHLRAVHKVAANGEPVLQQYNLAT